MSFKTSAALLVPLFILLVLMLPLKNGFTDDGYIHIQYARNIVNRGEYSFNPGEVSFGTTSPLWVMIQAALGRFLGTDEVLVVTSRVVSWLAGFLAVAAMFFLARSVGLTAVTSFCCSLVLAAHAWFVRWTALSMETSTAVLAVVLAGIAWAGAFENHRRASFLGFFMAVAALVRPEAYLLVPVYLLSVLLRGRRSDPRCVFRTLLVFALLVGPWLVFAKYHIGSFVPNTAGAKSGGVVLDPGTFIRKFEPIVKIVGSTDGIVGLLIAGSLVFRGRRSRVVSEAHRFLLLWVLTLPVAYVFFDIQVLSRYMLLTTPFTIVLGFLAVEEWSERFEARGARGRSGRWMASVAAAVALTVNVAFYFAVVVPPSVAFSHDLTHELKDLALFLRENSHEGDVVAAADIGYLAFYSGRRVLDLGGLVDDETSKLRETHTYEEIVEKGMYLTLPKYPSVQFFIDRERTAGRFDGKVMAGYTFESIRVTEVRNLGIRKPGVFYYTLYRLTRQGDEGV